VEVGNLDDLFGGGMGGFSEFFRRIFGGTPNYGGADFQRRQTGGRQTAQPATYQSEITISLLEAFQGTTRRIEIDGRRLEVKIPRGARSGTKVRVTDAISSADGRKNDLYLVVHVNDDPNFERKGSDLYTETEVDLYPAVLGGETRVKTLTGSVLLNLPAGTQPGQTFRLAGQGMPNIKNPDNRGDLFVRVKLRIPRNLSPEQRELFQKLAGKN
jgi:curved DNA-binding protein